MKAKKQKNEKYIKKIEKVAEMQGDHIYPYMEDEEKMIIPIFEFDEAEEHLYCVTVNFYEDENRRKNIIFGDEVVINEPELIFEFGYDTKESILKTFKSKEGFSRLKILECVSIGYNEIYALNDPSLFQCPDMLRSLSDLFIEETIYNIKDKVLYTIEGT